MVNWRFSRIRCFEEWIIIFIILWLLQSSQSCLSLVCDLKSWTNDTLDWMWMHGCSIHVVKLNNSSQRHISHDDHNQIGQWAQINDDKHLCNDTNRALTHSKKECKKSSKCRTTIVNLVFLFIFVTLPNWSEFLWMVQSILHQFESLPNVSLHIQMHHCWCYEPHYHNTVLVRWHKLHPKTHFTLFEMVHDKVNHRCLHWCN